MIAVVVEDLNRHAQMTRLDFPAPNRADGIAPHKAADDIRPACDGRKADVGFYVFIDIVEAFWCQG